MRYVMLLMTFLLLGALPASAQDSIPRATTVAPGGVAYQVKLGGEMVGGVHTGGVEWSRHSRLDTALNEIHRYVLEECRWECPQIWLVPAPLRVDIQTLHLPADSVPTDSVIEPEPESVWSIDSVTVYPADAEPTDSLRVTDLHWAAGTSYSCVTIDGEDGYAEVRTQEVNGLPYWVIVPGSPDWRPEPCAPSMALIPELPVDDWPAYRVGILGDVTPQPLPSSPVVAYDAGTLTVTWEPSPSEWVSHYSLAFGSNTGSGTTSAWSSTTGYTVETEITDGWICVRAVRGSELSDARCNSWGGG